MSLFWVEKDKSGVFGVLEAICGHLVTVPLFLLEKLFRSLQGKDAKRGHDHLSRVFLFFFISSCSVPVCLLFFFSPLCFGYVEKLF